MAIQTNLPLIFVQTPTAAQAVNPAHTHPDVQQAQSTDEATERLAKQKDQVQETEAQDPGKAVTREKDGRGGGQGGGQEEQRERQAAAEEKQPEPKKPGVTANPFAGHIVNKNI